MRFTYTKVEGFEPAITEKKEKENEGRNVGTPN